MFTKSYVFEDCVSEDIVSESMIYIWKIFDFNRKETIESYLFTILRNKPLDYLRHKKIEQSLLLTDSSWQKIELENQIDALEACNIHEILSKEILKTVNSIIHSLPEKTSKIFKMGSFKT